MRRRLGVLALVVAMVAASTAPAARAGDSILGGTCLFEFEPATFSGSTNAMTVHFEGSGPCFTDASLWPPAVGTLSFTVTLDSSLEVMTCLAGAAHGSGFFSIAGVLTSTGVDVTLAQVGGAWVALVATMDLHLVGVGVFAQVPLDTVLCQLAGPSGATWLGDFTFVDPNL